MITEFPMYRQLLHAAEQLPVAYRISREVICLPIYPDLSMADLDRILSLLHP